MNQSIFNVKSIKIGAINELENASYSRHIVIEIKDSENLDTTLFSDEEKTLRIEVEENKII